MFSRPIFLQNDDFHKTAFRIRNLISNNNVHSNPLYFGLNNTLVANRHLCSNS